MTSQELAAAALALRPAQFYDRRAFAKQSHHGYDTRERDIKIVTGACLHQAGVDLGERVERYDTGGAHAFVTRMGKWIWLHDWDRWVCAANGWNNGTISIEVSGRYCGVEGKLSTFWRAKSGDMPQVVTPVSMETLKQGLRWIDADLFARGSKLKVIVAHRQASASRPSDPGEGPWKGAALPMIAELGLTDVSQTTLGDGKPIPFEWDGKSPHRY
jgi:hypothetical protein